MGVLAMEAAWKKLYQPLPVPEKLLHNARKLRHSMTDAEQFLWYCLRRRQLDGFRFRRQHPFGNFVLDFYCPEARLVVELDGGQHNQASGAARDERRTALLEQHGISVLRVWNHDVFCNLEGVLQVIHQALLGRVDLDYGRVPPP